MPFTNPLITRQESVKLHSYRGRIFTPNLQNKTIMAQGSEAKTTVYCNTDAIIFCDATQNSIAFFVGKIIWYVMKIPCLYVSQVAETEPI